MAWQDFGTGSQNFYRMKYKIKSYVSFGLFALVVGFALTGCYETHYYHHYNHHTHGWYDRHHQAPPAGVRWDVDVEAH